MKGYTLEIPHNERMRELAKKYLEEQMPKEIPFESLDDLAAYVNYLRQMCGEYLDIIAESLTEEEVK